MKRIIFVRWPSNFTSMQMIPDILHIICGPYSFPHEVRWHWKSKYDVITFNHNKFATNVFTTVRLRTESKCVYFVLCCKEVIALMMEAERPLIHLMFFKNKVIEGSFLKYTHTALFWDFKVQIINRFDTISYYKEKCNCNSILHKLNFLSLKQWFGQFYKYRTVYLITNVFIKVLIPTRA